MLDINNLLGFQTKTPQRSEIVLDSPNGQGGVYTSVLAFTVQRKIAGEAFSAVGLSDFVYGSAIRINEDGEYFFAYMGDYNSASTSSVAITRNSKILTAAPSLDDVLVNGVSATSIPNCISGCAILKAGDLIRVQTPGNLVTSNTVNQTLSQTLSFKMTKLNS